MSNSASPHETAVTVERRGHVLLIGLNRPEKRNAFNVALIDQLAAAYYELEHDEDNRCGVFFDFASRYEQAIAEMTGWVLDGRLRSVEDTVPGDIEMFPGVLARLFSGQNTGKLALELRPTGGQT